MTKGISNGVNKVTIQELSSPGCSHCASAKNILEEIGPQFPEVEIEYIDMFSEQGQKMVPQYGIMSSPGIVINGELFSSGDLNKENLIAKIKSLQNS